METLEKISKIKKYIEKLMLFELKKYARTKNLPVKISYSNRMKRSICTTKEKRMMGIPYALEFTWSNAIIKEHYNDIKLIKGILYHELAHAIVGAEHGHDKIWKACAYKLGGITTTSVDLRQN